MQVLDPSKNSGNHLKDVMITAAKDGYQKFPGGATVGVQQRRFAYAPLSEPFTQEQINALQESREALFLLIGGVWKDNQQEIHYWSACQKVEMSNSLSWNNFSWRNL